MRQFSTNSMDQTLEEVYMYNNDINIFIILFVKQHNIINMSGKIIFNAIQFRRVLYSNGTVTIEAMQANFVTIIFTKINSPASIIVPTWKEE